MISVPQVTLVALDQSSRLEWLETSGTGAFAMGTVSGMNTRRYHALLVASLKPPVDRRVTLSRLEEQVDGVDLGVNAYPAAIHPHGHEKLTAFRLDPFPVWTWQVGEVRLEKRLFLVRGRSAVVVRYQASGPCTLTLRPLIALRDYHSLQHQNSALDGRWENQPGRFDLRPYEGLPAIRFFHDGQATHEGEGWYRSTQYREELARGLDFEEDLWCLGSVRYALEPGKTVSLCAEIETAEIPKGRISSQGALGDEAARQPLDSARGEREGSFNHALSVQLDAREGSLAQPALGLRLDALERAERLARQVPKSTPVIEQLCRAADAFRAQRADGQPTVLAGFPWFTDWGRDTMISLPGLLISRGMLDEASAVLRCFLGHLDQGLIPNRFPDSGERPEYNTADATLWLFIAVHHLLAAGGSEAFVRDEVLPKLLEIIQWHERGTHHGIGVARDGLLWAGNEGTQLTWMDAKVGDWVVTPRHGKAVELNALWFNALKITSELCSKFGLEEKSRELSTRAALASLAFATTFWNQERLCLYDVVRGDEKDARIRPNQIFAVSLPFTPLTAEQAGLVFLTVEKWLLTPYGLRTLAPAEPGYRPKYEGDQHSRDGAYHQGTVWPWLMGPYIDALLRVKGRSEKTLAECSRLLEPLEERLVSEGCLGQVSEVFDGDAPHKAGGCPAQAWSVAELLRLRLSVL
jgi:glycogen debranching enzyme